MDDLNPIIFLMHMPIGISMETPYSRRILCKMNLHPVQAAISILSVRDACLPFWKALNILLMDEGQGRPL